MSTLYILCIYKSYMNTQLDQHIVDHAHIILFSQLNPAPFCYTATRYYITGSLCDVPVLSEVSLRIRLDRHSLGLIDSPSPHARAE